MVEMLLNAGADPFTELNIGPDQPSDLVQKMALDLARKNAMKELLKREMERHKAAALSVMPANIESDIRLEIIR